MRSILLYPESGEQSGQQRSKEENDKKKSEQNSTSKNSNNSNPEREVKTNNIHSDNERKRGENQSVVADTILHFSIVNTESESYGGPIIIKGGCTAVLHWPPVIGTVLHIDTVTTPFNVRHRIELSCCLIPDILPTPTSTSDHRDNTLDSSSSSKSTLFMNNESDNNNENNNKRSDSNSNSSTTSSSSSSNCRVGNDSSSSSSSGNGSSDINSSQPSENIQLQQQQQKKRQRQQRIDIGFVLLSKIYVVAAPTSGDGNDKIIPADFSRLYSSSSSNNNNNNNNNNESSSSSSSSSHRLLGGEVSIFAKVILLESTPPSSSSASTASSTTTNGDNNDNNNSDNDDVSVCGSYSTHWDSSIYLDENFVIEPSGKVGLRAHVSARIHSITTTSTNTDSATTTTAVIDDDNKDKEMIAAEVDMTIVVDSMSPRGITVYGTNAMLGSKPLMLKSQLLLPEFLNIRVLQQQQSLPTPQQQEGGGGEGRRRNQEGHGVAVCCDTNKGIDVIKRLVSAWEGTSLLVLVTSTPSGYYIDNSQQQEQKQQEQSLPTLQHEQQQGQQQQQQGDQKSNKTSNTILVVRRPENILANELKLACDTENAKRIAARIEYEQYTTNSHLNADDSSSETSASGSSTTSTSTESSQKYKEGLLLLLRERRKTIRCVITADDKPDLDIVLTAALRPKSTSFVYIDVYRSYSSYVTLAMKGLKLLVDGGILIGSRYNDHIPSKIVRRLVNTTNDKVKANKARRSKIRSKDSLYTNHPDHGSSTSGSSSNCRVGNDSSSTSSSGGGVHSSSASECGSTTNNRTSCSADTSSSTSDMPRTILSTETVTVRTEIVSAVNHITEKVFHLPLATYAESFTEYCHSKYVFYSPGSSSISSSSLVECSPAWYIIKNSVRNS